MTQFWMLAFWAGVATLVYAYLGFPLLVLLIGSFRRTRSVPAQHETPRTSLLIAAYNEGSGIGARLDNALGADYPAAQLEIIVASDGSNDQTNEVVASYADRGVRLLRLPRCGKIAALDAAVHAATGEILVFSDANTLLEPNALRALVRNFADPQVGGVVGHTGYRIARGSESSGLGERLYWRYDSWLKQLESRAGSVVSAHGGLYALRRELYSAPADGAMTDDFAISTCAIAAGTRLVFEPDARAWEDAAPAARQEFGRRVRLMTRGLRAVAYRRALLNPLRTGVYALFLFSHKVVRRLVPLALIVLLIASWGARDAGGMYTAALSAQAAFYALAAAGWLTRRASAGRSRLLYVPFYYCMANAAALVALIRFVRGDRIAVWQPTRQSAHPG